MARPTKWRQINNIPEVTNFVPANNVKASAEKNVLKLEELEAIRLKDSEGLDQDQCAQQMQVSRPTFRRILLSAREKIADSLINGKAISIEGGKFTRNICHMHCNTCGHVWNESFENVSENENNLDTCPKCGSNEVACGAPLQNGFCMGRCRRHGQNNRCR